MSLRSEFQSHRRIVSALGLTVVFLACRPLSEPSEHAGRDPGAGGAGQEALTGRMMRNIAFVSDRDGNLEVYAMTSLGTQQKNLSLNPADDFDPSWSPKGQKIVFVRRSSSGSHIWVMDPGGGSQMRLSGRVRGAPPYADSPRWSPDGTRIAFVASASPGAPGDLVIVGAAGGLERSITSGGWVLGAAAWSPAGDRLTFIGRRSGPDSLYRVNADGTGLIQLAPATVPSLYPLVGPERVPEPCWAPGPRILYTDAVEGNAELFSIDPSGGSPFSLTPGLSPIADVSRGCWSPDASSVLAGIAFPDQHDLFGLPPTGVAGRNDLIQFDLTDCLGGLACLGRGYNPGMTKILFYRQDPQFELGPFQVWIMNPEGTGQVRLTTAGSNTDPEWRP